MTRYEFVKTLTPEEFLIFMTKKECSSVCEHNANGERWRKICNGQFKNNCDGCKRNFWLEEDVSNGSQN